MTERELNATRNALIKQLLEKGFDKKKHKFYFDGVEDYVHLARILGRLYEDIENRGVYVTLASTGTQKKNESVGEAAKIRGQMDKLLTFLKLQPPDVPIESEAPVHEIL